MLIKIPLAKHRLYRIVETEKTLCYKCILHNVYLERLSNGDDECHDTFKIADEVVNRRE